MVSTRWANVQIVRKLSVKQHRPAIVAFRPKVFGHLATGEERVNFWANVIGDPVHRLGLLTISERQLSGQTKNCN